ncbi:DUF995 domain-containing protein [Microvirga zambiensis]|uniref:DUF995 domain-containing protein n=1 Tax=Microvirga zambiensis TaxID=1402137 RepID=UPI00191F948D|nr:DUF995 domain-containing protein [Microvirga zambiensis]
MTHKESRRQTVIGRVLTAAIFAAAAIAVPSLSVAQTYELPRMMNSRELLELYGDKTWRWDEGGGYLHRDGRFTAFVPAKSVANSTYAEGQWSVNDNGVMCFDATWHVGKKTKSDGKCFQHKVLGEAIFQRVLPDGDWYTFRTAKVPLPQNEYAKFSPSDMVTSQAKRLKAVFDR